MPRTRAEIETMECIVTPITRRLVRPDQDPIVYVAGPMRGIEEFNFPAFDEGRDYVNSLGKYQVISPADVDREEGLDTIDLDIHNVAVDLFQLCMRRDLEIVANAHAIFLLKGWEKSTGANNELFVANVCGVEVWVAVYYDDGTLKGHTVAEEQLIPPMTGGPAVTPTNQTILEEANGLIYGPRQEAYGHPYVDMTRTGKMWGAILGIDAVPAELVALCMVAVKISREVNRPKRDSRVDMAGYAGCVDRIQTYKEAHGID